MKLIIENEFYDRDFVRENVYGFEEFKNYVKMLLFDYVVKEMGFLCEEIEDFVFGFFEKRGVIYMGYGF